MGIYRHVTFHWVIRSGSGMRPGVMMSVFVLISVCSIGTSIRLMVMTIVIGSSIFIVKSFSWYQI